MNIYQVRDIYAYADGDCIMPSMGVSIDSGYSLTQYWNVQEEKVVNTDFTQHNAKLFPQAFSSNGGKVIVPESGEWFYNSTTVPALKFDSSGNCTTPGCTGLFKLTTISVNGQTQPCLVICGNLATKTDLTSKMIYYVGKYDDMTFTCQQEITVVTAMADSYDVIVSAEGPGGVSGDNVITNDSDYVIFRPYMLRGGVQVSGATFTWERLANGAWSAVTHKSGEVEISADGSIKIYEKAVYGVEYFRVTAAYGASVTVKKVVNVSDTQDPYYLLDGCSTSGEVKSGTSAVFKPQVYVRSTNVPDTANDWKYAFTVTSSDSGDVLMTANTTLTLTYAQIRGYGGRVKVQTRGYY